MAAGNKVGTEPAKVDEVDELFAGLQDGGATEAEDPFAGVEDLLDEVQEDDSEGWVPAEKGEGLFGVIVKIGQTRSDFPQPGKDPMCPTITVDGFTISADGDTRTKGKYRVIGYGTVLRREMEELLENEHLKVNAKVALKYFGEKIVRNGPYAGKPFKHYGIAVK